MSSFAQAMIKPYNRCSFHEVQSLSFTKRGKGGLGSTGER